MNEEEKKCETCGNTPCTCVKETTEETKEAPATEPAAE
jgi:hypothetical protein